MPRRSPINSLEDLANSIEDMLSSEDTACDCTQSLVFGVALTKLVDLLEDTGLLDGHINSNGEYVSNPDNIPLLRRGVAAVTHIIHETSYLYDEE